ncbi:MAG: eukaryotic-like serine/threonine-protein kinase [Solirubrobacteraceae bacterium]|jgi:serine/threonine protein kinase|nr:eukaryotic-like serine/threonine-protein kinase [Solirubrobacteraceae bacterium]
MRAAAGSCAQVTEPFPLRSATSWGFEPGDAVAPGRRVLRRLGHGGGHETFLVEMGGSSLAVAKLPRPRLAGDVHRLVSLRDEGRALSRLASPAVPRHLDTVLDGPHPHLLMEYVAGPTLRTAIASRGSLPASLVAGLGRAMALALDVIECAGWVHLDVKPENIVLNAAPRLVDFELARPAVDAARMTEPTGTWQYMPPEQRAAGTWGAARIGPPADVFALALTLCEALTGRSRERAPEPEVPSGAVGRVLADALAPAPEDRPQAAELAAALAGLSDDEPQLALAA